MSDSLSIGKKLKRTREGKGLSIEDVSAQTRIHHKVLKAIEEDKFEELPSPTYVKGFLKRYAVYLGLDAGSILKEYIATSPKEPEQILVLNAKESQWPAWPGLRRLVILASVASALVITLSLGIFFIIKAVKARPKTSKVAASVQRESAVPEKTRRRPAKSEPSASVEPLVLSITAKEDVWLQVAIDGEVIFENVLSPGDRETWQAHEEIILRVGNAGGIEIELDGKSLGSPGAFGEMINRITLTKKGMKIEK